MKFLIALFFLVGSQIAFSASPSLESAKRLVALTGSQKMLDNVNLQIDKMMRSMLDERLKNTPNLTPALREERQRSFDDFMKRINRTYREELNWEAFEKVIVLVFIETYSQEEVDGLIAFYESPIGRAYVEKTPIVLQKTMSEVQRLVLPVMQKIQAETTDFTKKI